MYVISDPGALSAIDVHIFGHFECKDIFFMCDPGALSAIDVHIFGHNSL